MHGKNCVAGTPKVARTRPPSIDVTPEEGKGAEGRMKRAPEQPHPRAARRPRWTGGRPPTLAVADGDRELGEYLSSECVTCHQLQRPRYDGIPSIVGLAARKSFVEILSLVPRPRSARNPVMRSIAVKFNDDEIAALAAYFGSLTPKTDETSATRQIRLSEP